MSHELPLSRIAQIFDDFHRDGHAPDVVFGVFQHGQLLHVGHRREHATGAGLDEHSVFRIASMTKSFTAAAALIARDAGLLRFDQPLGEIVPELAGLAPVRADAPDLTVRMLLTMSGGLASDDPWADRQESMTADEFSTMLRNGMSFVAVPGTSFHYSNLGYAIVGRAIANATGASFRDFVRAHLIEPLGLTSTAFSLDEVDLASVVTGHRRLDGHWDELPFSGPGEFSPIGGLFSCVADIARWAGWLGAAFGHSGGGGPLSAASRREMQQAMRWAGASVVDGTAVRSSAYGFGLNVLTDSRWGPIPGHSGGYPGYGTNMRWHLGTGYGVVALANGTYAPAARPAGLALDAVLDAVDATAVDAMPWPATTDAMHAVQSLLLAWDDDVADRLFSPNMDMDLPRWWRRQQIDEAMARLGRVEPAPADVQPAPSAAQIAWTVRGDRGMARITISLTPERTPRVQQITVAATEAPLAH